MPIRSYLKDPIDDAALVFHLTYSSISRCEDDLSKTIGISYQQYIILGAIEKNMPVTPSFLANWLDRHPNSITLLLNRMEKDGLIERVRDLKDRRVLKVVATKLGKEKRKKALQISREINKKLLSVLSKKELSTFSDILRKILEASFEYRNIKDKVIDAPPANENGIL